MYLLTLKTRVETTFRRLENKDKLSRVFYFTMFVNFFPETVISWAATLSDREEGLTLFELCAARNPGVAPFSERF